MTVPLGSDPKSPSTEGRQVAATGDVPELAAARPMRKDVWRRFKQNRLAVAGLVFLVFIAFLAIFADVVAPYGFAERPGAWRCAGRAPR